MKYLAISFISLLLLFGANNLYRPGWEVVEVGSLNETKTNSTAAEQDFTSIWSIPASYLDTGNIVKILAGFEATTGATTVTYTLYLEIDGVKVYTNTQDANNSVTRSQGFVIELQGTETPATGADVEATVTTGTGNAMVFGSASNNIDQPVALDTDTEMTVVFGVQFSGTTATESLTFRNYRIEILR